jgi:hypothetical protein
MTIEELAKRVEVLEAEVSVLRKLVFPDATPDNYLPGFGAAGRFKDDPTFQEAVRLGKAYRDRVNRESLEEMDREEAKSRETSARTTNGSPPARGKGRKKKPKPRKSDAGA